MKNYPLARVMIVFSEENEADENVIILEQKL